MYKIMGGQFWSCEHNQFNDVGRRMVAKNPKKIWREWNMWKKYTKYGTNGTEEIQHTVSSVEME